LLPCTCLSARQAARKRRIIDVYVNYKVSIHGRIPFGGQSQVKRASCRFSNAKPLNSETEVLRQIVPNEKPRYWAGLEVGGFPSGTSTSFLKKVRMRSRCEAAMS
jgi:hypothetical protein